MRNFLLYQRLMEWSRILRFFVLWNSCAFAVRLIASFSFSERISIKRNNLTARHPARVEVDYTK